MIPLRDNQPTRQFPVMTVLLIAANVAVFVADYLTRQPQYVGVVMTPRGPVEAYQDVGRLSLQYAMMPAQVTGDFSSAWITIFTSMFLHANLLHIAGNMLMLWIFGNNVEDTLGRIRFLAFYLACGVAAAAAHILSNPHSDIPTVGASGAVAGIMGAYLILFPHARVLTLVVLGFIATTIEVPALLVIGVWAALQFLKAGWLGGGEMLKGGGVAYMAHVGGFMAGVLLILLLGGQRLIDRRDQYRREYDD